MSNMEVQGIIDSGLNLKPKGVLYCTMSTFLKF